MNAKLEIDGLTKEFPSKGGATVALSDVDLTVGEGELFTIVGASGCGKSTLLEIIAGFIEPTSGQVLLDGENIDGPGRTAALSFSPILSSPGVLFTTTSPLVWRWVG